MKKLLTILFICICLISCNNNKTNDKIYVYTGYIIQYKPGNFVLSDRILVKTDDGKLLETTAAFKWDLIENNSIITKQYYKEKQHIRITVSGNGPCLNNHGIIPIK